MSEFIGSNGRLTFEQGMLRIIREEAPAEVLAECEKFATKQRVIAVESQKNTLFSGGYLALIVNPAETTFKIKFTSDCPPNLVLIDNGKQMQAAEPLIAEIQAALASGQELYFVNLDPSELPAPELEKHSASPEWQDVASEIKAALLQTDREGFFVISVRAPEYPNFIVFQGLFPPGKIHLELSTSDDPPYGEEVLSALAKAGWQDPSEAIPNFNQTVAWSDQDAGNVANFLANTLQWCLFLDAATVKLSFDQGQ
jgi:hypothetical protein